MKVIFIRHTSVNVPKGTCYGQTDVPVSATFAAEAALVAEHLKACGPFDRVYSSPLGRCTQLAAFCGYTTPILDNRLMELNMGLWEMKLYADITGPEADAWYADYLHVPTPGGESFEMQYRRLSHFLDNLKTQRGLNQVAVFAHCGILISARIYAGLAPFEDGFKDMPPYGGSIEIEL